MKKINWQIWLIPVLHIHLQPWNKSHHSIYHLWPPVRIWICSLLAAMETVTLFWLEAGGQVWLLIWCLGWRVEEKLWVSVCEIVCLRVQMYVCVRFKGGMILEATQSIRDTWNHSDTRAPSSSYYINVFLCVSWFSNWSPTCQSMFAKWLLHLLSTREEVKYKNEPLLSSQVTKANRNRFWG